VVATDVAAGVNAAPAASRDRRRPRRCVVVLAGQGQPSDGAVEALLASLREFGVTTRYLGREQSARRIAQVVRDEHADTVELCLAGGGGLSLLRDLLHEFVESGRRDVSIVPHRVELRGTILR
jgi:methylmalonyl-CoA mutase cobalamin-binding subunit